MRTKGDKGGTRRLIVILLSLGICALMGASAHAQTLPAMHTITVVSGLTRPVFVTAPPGDYNRIFIVEQQVAGVGRIRILNLASGTLNAAPFLTVSGIATGNEQGLLGLAFDPDYATNGKFYIHYTASGAGDIVVKQYQVSGNPDIADTTATNIHTLITFTHPQGNHNAGWIGFSPRPNDDHNLYISSGDGGNGNDTDGGVGHHEPGGNAQWDQTLLGKMLRIHVDPLTAAVTIPSDNPNAGSIDPSVKKEIWLLGLRNPYRDSFDRATGRMFLGDVGQDAREEIDVQQPDTPGGGQNYGWRVREGLMQNTAYPSDPVPTGAIDPILDYPRSGNPPTVPLSGTTVTGGYVYRGKQIPKLNGFYLFGDYSAGKIFYCNYDGATVTNKTTITGNLFPTIDQTPVNLINPSSFGEDANGELYICDLANTSVGQGRVYKIIPVTPNVKIDSVLSNGISFTIDGTGVPFTNVTLESTSDLTQAFGSGVSVAVGADGTFHFNDPNPGSARFYRVTYP